MALVVARAVALSPSSPRLVNCKRNPSDAATRVLSDRYHLTKHRLITSLPAAPARPATGIAALTFFGSASAVEDCAGLAGAGDIVCILLLTIQKATVADAPSTTARHVLVIFARRGR